jgi:phenylalanyl-tRNA synthetase beta chain
MNHYGVAREAATIYGVELKPLSFPLPAAQPAASPFNIQIEAQDACGRFTARVLRNITIGESRDWFPGAEIATYFALLEQKKISNAVDATNFAWLAMGQPTHAFDLDKIEGGIVVRRPRTRRPHHRRPRQAPWSRRRHGRLGHNDYALHHQRPR